MNKIGQIIYQGKTNKGNDIFIRYPREDDAPLLMDFINTLSKEQTFIRFQGEQVTLEEETKYLNSQIKMIKENLAVQLLVFSNRKLIGNSDINMFDRVEKHVGIFGIIIAKEYRGEGIGKLLFKFILEEAKKNLLQLKIITLGVFSNNKLAYKLYKNFGFAKYGRLPKGYIHKNKLVDRILMYKNMDK